MSADANVTAFWHAIEYDLDMQLRYNYRLYPTPGQVQALARLFGCVRVVYNDGLQARTQAHDAGLPYVATRNCRPGSLPPRPPRPGPG